MSENSRNPFPTVDIIIEIDGGIVLIERKNPPPGWAMPGGFVDYGETVERAAVREAKEETCLAVLHLLRSTARSAPSHFGGGVYCDGPGHAARRRRCARGKDLFREWFACADRFRPRGNPARLFSLQENRPTAETVVARWQTRSFFSPRRHEGHEGFG